MRNSLKYSAVLLTTAMMLGGVTAAPNFGNPGQTPGDALYGLDRAMESLSLALTFSKQARANKSLKFARERLAEAKQLQEMNRTELANRSVGSYQKMIQKARRIGESVSQAAKQQNINGVISNATMEHARVLNQMKVTAGDPMYQAKTGAEEVAVGLETNAVQKARKQAEVLQHRVNETKFLADTNRTQAIERTMNHYNQELQQMQRIANVTDNRTRMKVQEIVANATQKHIQVLERVREKVPEQARQGIDNALNNSRKGHQNAVDAFKKAKNVLQEMPGGLPGKPGGSGSDQLDNRTDQPAGPGTPT
ncbi:MAG: DUF5667 domain-containing protein [Candidatus Nanohaloarchaea archaeon]